MAKPDPDSEAGRTDWREWLTTVLPHTDIFLPSIDEILFMLNRPLHDKISARAGREQLLSAIDGEILNDLSEELLSMGVAIVVIKLGEQGLYMKTTDDRQRLQKMEPDRASFSQWRGVELLKPCFEAQVVGTTGSGDSSIAGFLSAISSDADELPTQIGRAHV